MQRFSWRSAPAAVRCSGGLQGDEFPGATSGGAFHDAEPVDEEPSAAKVADRELTPLGLTPQPWLRPVCMMGRARAIRTCARGEGVEVPFAAVGEQRGGPRNCDADPPSAGRVPRVAVRGAAPRR
jgi:hypothetical protein